MLKKSATDAFKAALKKKQFQKTAETTGGLMVNKNANKITKVLKNSQQNNSEMRKRMITKYLKKDIYLKKRQKIIDDMRLK